MTEGCFGSTDDDIISTDEMMLLSTQKQWRKSSFVTLISSRRSFDLRKHFAFVFCTLQLKPADGSVLLMSLSGRKRVAAEI